MKLRLLFIASIALLIGVIVGVAVGVTAYNNTPRPSPTARIGLAPSPTAQPKKTASPVATKIATPAPLPSPVVGLMPGQGVQLAHFYVTLDSAALIQAPPGIGQYYLEVKWTLRNTTGVTRTLYQQNFTIEDSNGSVYQPAANMAPLPMPPYGSVAPGASISGTVSYTVPINKAMNYITIFQYTDGTPQAEWTFSVAAVG